jgi:hypothetical protein
MHGEQPVLGVQGVPRRVCVDRFHAHRVQRAWLHQGGGCAHGDCAGCGNSGTAAEAVRGLGLRRDRGRSAPESAAETPEKGVKTVVNSTGIRHQATGNRLATARKCATEGCNRLAWNDDFCPRCEEEIRALEQMAEADEMRQARALNARELRSILKHRERAESLRRVGRFVSRWIWVPQLAFVAGVVMYLAWVWGAAFLKWQGWF